MNKKSLLLINKIQFGYHTDSYKYCEYLRNEFNITYICFDTNQQKYKMDHIKIIYIPAIGSFFNRGCSFIKSSRKYIKKNNYDLIFIVYFQMSSLLKIGFSKYKFVLDIRTGSVANNAQKRKILNSILLIESFFYKNITIISESLREKLYLDKKKCYILPLGSDQLSIVEKTFDDFKLLYVGALNYRNIHETVIGVSKFIKNNNNNIKITYDIFGFGSEKEEILLKNTIIKEELSDTVIFHGRKNHIELKPYFDKCNIGISYIPMTEYYDCQPPTKTFEYINAGMICIATNTSENKRVVSINNGILCDDNPDSLSKVLNDLCIKEVKYNSLEIIDSLKEYTWENIANKKLLSIINTISEKRKLL